MFTQADLTVLMSAAPPLGVSIFLPTHVQGREVRQDPIRLKNLTGLARERLLAAGLSPADAVDVLAPALALVEDHAFWQHQDHGLALFLDSGAAHVHQVPVPVAERVIVGPGFHVRPLLNLLAADGAFGVLTITADKAKLFDASRFAIVEDRSAALPDSNDEPGASDYQNPVQASPVARPHTGSIDISNAQVYGDSPQDWRKDRLVEFTRRVAAAVDAHYAARPVPLVLIADAEIGGHFQKFSTLGPLLAGVLEANPATMDDSRLREAAYAVVQPHLDAARTEAVARFQSLHGSGDTRAVAGVQDVVRAAYQGRVDTLLVTEDGSVQGRYDEGADEVVIDQQQTGIGPDLLDAAAAQTAQHGGGIQLLTGPPPTDERIWAILRY